LGNEYAYEDTMEAFYEENNRNRQTVTQTYMLNGEYTSFYGTIVLSSSSKNSDLVGTVRIIGYGKDGEIKVSFEQDDITQGFLPKDFNLDVTGVEQLDIEVEGYKYRVTLYEGLILFIVNSYLVKEA